MVLKNREVKKNDVNDRIGIDTILKYFKPVPTWELYKDVF